MVGKPPWSVYQEMKSLSNAGLSSSRAPSNCARKSEKQENFAAFALFIRVFAAERQKSKGEGGKKTRYWHLKAKLDSTLSSI
jgi:hypothetical protein